MRLASGFALLFLSAPTVVPGAAARSSVVQIVQVPGQPQPGLPQMPPRDTREQKTGTARLRGRVVAADSGTPLRRAQVRASSAELRESRMTSTDSEGRYELKDLPAGRYIVVASKGSYITLQFGQLRPLEPGKPIQLGDGEALDKVDFSLPRGGVITGRVVDEFGEPVADVMVQAMQNRMMGGRRRVMPVTRPGQTNDLGEFRIFGLAPGQYYLSATYRSFGPSGDSDERSGYAPTFYPGTTSAADAQRITLNVGQELSNISFTLIPTRTARISGTVTDSRGRSLANGFVGLRDSSRGPAMMMVMGGGGQIRPDGSFAIPNVPPGEYWLEARTMMRGGPSEEAEFASVPVTVAGEDLGNITIVTSKGATATGQISFEAGATSSFAPSGVRIVAQPAGSDPTPTMAGGGGGRVQGDWTFEIKSVIGPRLIRAFGLPNGWWLKAVFLNGSDVTDTPMEFKGGDVSGLQVVLTNRAAAVTGTVRTANGQPAKDYSIVIFSDESAKWGFLSRSTKTGRPDQDGRYDIRGLPQGRYLGAALEYLEQGQAEDPEFLERLRNLATPFTLGEGETKSLDLKLVAVG